MYSRTDAAQSAINSRNIAALTHFANGVEVFDDVAAVVDNLAVLGYDKSDQRTYSDGIKRYGVERRGAHGEHVFVAHVELDAFAGVIGGVVGFDGRGEIVGGNADFFR